jgi:hypothetical protein
VATKRLTPITFGASTTSVPALNIAQGSAVSTPTDGDVFHDSTGLKFYDGTNVNILNNCEVFPFSRGGTLTAAAGTARCYLTGNYKLLDYRVSVGTAPTGSTLIVDCNKNGTTIFTTQGNRPTVSISGFLATTTAPDVTTFASGDYITIDIDQIGSTVAGTDLVVVFRMIRQS